MFLLYNAGMTLLVATVLVPWQGLAILGGRSRWEHLAQRLGRPMRGGRTEGRRILLHACDVGEISIARRIMAEFQDGQVEFVLSVGTVPALEWAQSIQRFSPLLREVCLLPWDRNRAMVRWLQAMKPDVVGVVETEIWPGLFTACRSLDIPLCMLAARLYPRDVPRYLLAGKFFQRVLNCTCWIGVTSEHERQRFLTLGADPDRVVVVGNPRYDPLPVPVGVKPARPGDGLLIVAGSTHTPEERWLCDALKQIRRKGNPVRLILAPRRIQRAAGIVRKARHLGLSVVRGFEIPEEDGWEVLVVDRLGALPDLYRIADVAVVGGSFVDRGGHNVLEPAACGTPVIVGPFTAHFEESVEFLRRGGTLLQISSREELAPALERLLEDRDLREQIGSQAKRLVESRRGSSRIYAEALRRFLNRQGRQERQDF